MNGPGNHDLLAAGRDYDDVLLEYVVCFYIYDIFMVNKIPTTLLDLIHYYVCSKQTMYIF